MNDLPDFYLVYEGDGNETYFDAESALLVPTATLDEERKQDLEDGDTENNDPPNLMAFASHSDHMRWHRAGGEESGVIPIWRGDNAQEITPKISKAAPKKEIEMANGSKISFTGNGEKHEGHPDAPDPFFNPQPKVGKGGKKQ